MKPSIMRRLRAVLILIIGTLLITPTLTAFSDSQINQFLKQAQNPTPSPTPKVESIVPTSQTMNPAAENDDAEVLIAQPTPTPEPTPDPFTELYGCEMELAFINGPLEGSSTMVDILGRDYFEDKGDKFAPGKGTGIYYEDHHYFIFHSSFVNGNILKPMEAEFLRRYLENWGNTDTTYIQNNIDTLIGSEVVWVCNGKSAYKTKITGVTRLSHAASERLWLNPSELESILKDREGLASEWVGKIQPTENEVIYLGFCGWGPSDLDYGRFTYFRYLLQFEVELVSDNFLQ